MTQSSTAPDPNNDGERSPYQTIPLSPLRKIIASRMVEAKQNIPHYRLTVHIELDELLLLRQQLNQQIQNTQDQLKISVNDFVLKASAEALMIHPEMNCQLIDNQLHQYTSADISMVVAVEDGLSTPVIRQANRKSLCEIARESKDLATRAINRQLSMTEIEGGSFSVSNLGAAGIDQFDAIINPPQCAILAVATANSQAIIKDSQIQIGTLMRVTLSCDHRAIDGATGARFLRTFKNLIEQTDKLITPQQYDSMLVRP